MDNRTRIKTAYNEYNGWRKENFLCYISFKWWTKKYCCGSTVGAIATAKLSKFRFKSRCKKTNSKIVNDLASVSWASQFKIQYCHTAPPKSLICYLF